MDVGHRAGAREAGIDVNHRGATGFGLHDPLEADRMALGHVGAFDDDAVAIGKVLLEVAGAAATERGPQTGDGGAVSYARLVLDLHRTHRGVELAHQVVLFVVERGAAERSDAHATSRAPLLPRLADVLLPALGARLHDPVGDHFHRRVEVEVFPFGAVRTAVAHRRDPRRGRDELGARTTFRAQPAAADRRVRISFDLS